jgi:hypothetical protein
MAELFNREMSERDYRSKVRRSRLLEPELLSPITGHADEAGVDALVAPCYPRGKAPTSREHRHPKRATTSQRGSDQQ